MQLPGTPITAEFVDGVDSNVDVVRKYAQGRFVTASWSKSSGWDLPNGGSLVLDGRDRVALEKDSWWIAFSFFLFFDALGLLSTV